MSGEIVESLAGVPLVRLGVLANTHHHACEGASRDAVSHACEAGRSLAEAKRRVPYGQWGHWLAENFDAAERTAQLYMQLAETDPQRVAGLSLRDAARSISTPKPKRVTPDDASELLQSIAAKPSAPQVIGGARPAPILPQPSPSPPIEASSLARLDALSDQQARKIARVVEMFGEAEAKLRELERPLSGYARAELAREASVISQRAGGVLSDLAASFR